MLRDAAVIQSRATIGFHPSLSVLTRVKVQTLLVGTLWCCDSDSLIVGIFNVALASRDSPRKSSGRIAGMWKLLRRFCIFKNKLNIFPETEVVELGRRAADTAKLLARKIVCFRKLVYHFKRLVPIWIHKDLSSEVRYKDKPVNSFAPRRSGGLF